MAIDAIIISDSQEDSVSGSNPLKLKLQGRVANIQVVNNYLRHQGKIKLPIKYDGMKSWSSAPKLNGLFLFSYLNQNKFQVALVNSYYEEKKKFINLLNENPRAVIISTTFIHNKKSLCNVAKDIRALAPDVFIIVGGPFIYLSYMMLQRSSDRDYDTQSAKEDLLFLNIDNEPSVDLYIISPRGEKTLCKTLKCLIENRSIGGIPNSARLSGETYIFTSRIDDVSDAPEVYIDWNSLPNNFFQTGALPMQASNGCPYRCTFCNFNKDRRLLYIKPSEQLICEMESVSNHGAQYIWFVDDNFRLGRGDLDAFCRSIISRGISLKWMSFMRASTLENVNAKLLRQSGCIEVQLGLESADPQILKNMNKRSTPELYEKTIRKLLSAGINCSCYFIFGFPGETDETAQRTVEFIKRIDSLNSEGYVAWSIFPFILSPLSPIYENEMRQKYHLTGYMKHWKHSSMDSKRALYIVLKAFMEIENSGAIYRGDNLDILNSLDYYKRKEFQVIRHRLSKLALNGRIDSNEIVESFAGILTQGNENF
jgi:anaerobic magnesium-protoporphyrin IX monomethyl ester cyclase